MDSSNIIANILHTTNTSKKSLRELSQATSTLGLYPESSSVDHHHHPFLTQGGIDTARLQRQVHELEFHQPPSSNDNAPKKQRCVTDPHTTSLTQYLNYTRNVQFESIFQQEIEKVKQKTEERVQSRLLDDWNEMKQKILNSVVGGRRLGGIDLTRGDDNDFDSLGRMEPATYMDESGALPSFVKKHLDLLLTCSNDSSKVGAITLSDLEKLLEDQNKKDSMTLGYYNATRLLGFMPSSVSNNIVEEQAVGVLKFLSLEFKSFLISSVKNSGGIREERGPGLLGCIIAFIEMEVGREKVGSGGMDIVWRCLYYCLRCGDASAALEVVQFCKETPPAILQILQFMAQSQKQQNTGNLFESTSQAKLSTISSALRQNVVDLHHRATSLSQGSGKVDAYELVCLAMLSLSDPSSKSQVETTMEDYVYMSLWNAVYSCENDETSSLSCVSQIETLGKTVQHWGPTHFDDEGGTNAWAYAMPLFLCQQFRCGLIHVANIGGGKGLCMAVHLALGMHNLRSIVWDSGNSRDEQMQEDKLLSKFLVTYSLNLQSVSPLAAFTYLVQIPDCGRVKSSKTSVWMKNGQQMSNTTLNQICRLLLDTKAFQVLAGYVSSDGTRNSNGAVMDAYLTSDAVSMVLATAANKAVRQGNLNDAAELLALAGHYSTLLALLNRELASLLLTGEKESRRIFWRNAAMRFHEAYLLKDHTHVLQILETENKLSLGTTFQLLLNLMAFFDCCYENKWENAWALMDKLDLFPKTKSEIPHKVESFVALDAEVQQQFHHVITNTMESLYQQHKTLKANIGGDLISASVTAIRQRLDEVRVKGSLLVTFAGLIPLLNLSDEAKAKIARMEAFMI